MPPAGITLVSKGGMDASKPTPAPSSKQAPASSSGYVHGSGQDEPNDDEDNVGGGGDFPDPSDDESGPANSNTGEETSEEESGTDDEVVAPTDCQNCAMLQVELEKTSKMCQAFLFTMEQGFHRMGEGTLASTSSLPDDRLELAQLAERLKIISSHANARIDMMIGNMSEYAFYICYGNTTKVIYMNAKHTIKKMKEKALVAFGIAKSNVKMFDFIFNFGHRSYHRQRGNPWFHKGEVMQKELNRMKVWNIFNHTVKLDMKLAGGLAGGGTRVKNNALKEHAMSFKKGLMKEHAEKAKSITVNELPNALKEASTLLNELYEKLEPHPSDTFAKLLSTMSPEELQKCLDAFKTHKPEPRIAKLCEIVMKHHLPKLYGIKADYDHVMQSVATFFDLMITSAYAKSDMEWNWAKAKKDIGHMKELKDMRIASTMDSPADVLANAMANTHMSD